MLLLFSCKKQLQKRDLGRVFASEMEIESAWEFDDLYGPSNTTPGDILSKFDLIALGIPTAADESEDESESPENSSDNENFDVSFLSIRPKEIKNEPKEDSPVFMFPVSSKWAKLGIPGIYTEYSECDAFKPSLIEEESNLNVNNQSEIAELQNDFENQDAKFIELRNIHLLNENAISANNLSTKPKNFGKVRNSLNTHADEAKVLVDDLKTRMQEFLQEDYVHLGDELLRLLPDQFEDAEANEAPIEEEVFYDFEENEETERELIAEMNSTKEEEKPKEEESKEQTKKKWWFF